MTNEKFLSLDWIGRFKQTIQTIKDNRVIWVLKNPDGTFPLCGSSGGPSMLAVWGEKEQAQYNCNDAGWEACIATQLSFDEFMTELCPKMKKDKVKIILVSPMNSRRGKEITFQDFMERIGIGYRETDECVQDEDLSNKKNPIPINDKTLKGLFDYLDVQLSEKVCKEDLSMTTEYLKLQGVPDIDNALDWLRSKGGYCDCEVLANVEE